MGQRGGKHKGTHHGRSFRSSPIEALQSNSSKKEGEGEKRRLLYFVQSEPSPYLWLKGQIKLPLGERGASWQVG